MNVSVENKKFIENLFENIAVDIVVVKKCVVFDGWKETNLVREYSKLYLFLGGEGSITIDHKRYEPKRGQLMLIPEGVQHSFDTVNGDCYRKYYCHFNAKIGALSIFDIIDCHYIFDVDEDQMNHLSAILDEMIGYYESNTTSSKLYVKSSCLKLLGYFFDHTVIRGTKLESQTLVAMKETADYIEAHIAEELSVDRLAKKCHLHPNYFSQVFKSTYGIPPVKFINNTRMEKAKQLLVTTDYPIGEIAKVVGFLNVYYFSSTFKKYGDMSPSNFRKLYHEI